MILQRLASSIKRQDWFQVIIEILIVIVGIFLGLQVTEWNEGRQERQNEIIFLNRIHNELQETLTINKASVERKVELNDALRTAVISIFNSSENQTLNELQCSAVYYSDMLSSNMSNMTSLNVMLNTGQTDVIRNQTLVDTFNKFNEQSRNLETFLSIANSMDAFLAWEFPELFQITPFWGSSTRVPEGQLNYRAVPECDIGAMQANVKFKIGLSRNTDMHHAYVTTRLSPLSETLINMHILLDQELGTTHEGEAP